MAFIRIAMVALVLAAGCKKNRSQGEQSGTAAATAVDLGPMDPLVAEVHEGLAGFRDEMCACPDVGCADAVMIRLGQWTLEHKDRFGEVDQKSTPAQIEAARKISAEHDACARKLVGR